MPVTRIDTNSLPRTKLNGAQGEVVEVINKALCGAENVLATLRWLGEGERFDAEALADTHQLIYLMEGEGVITLGSKHYDVGKGAGIYLGPSEGASISHAGDETLKLFHLIVPKIEDA